MDNLKELIVEQCTGIQTSSEEAENKITPITSAFLSMTKSILCDKRLETEKIIVLETCPEFER